MCRHKYKNTDLYEEIITATPAENIIYYCSPHGYYAMKNSGAGVGFKDYIGEGKCCRCKSKATISIHLIK